jgi:hypothetical protein
MYSFRRARKARDCGFSIRGGRDLGILDGESGRRGDSSITVTDEFFGIQTMPIGIWYISCMILLHT